MATAEKPCLLMLLYVVCSCCLLENRLTFDSTFNMLWWISTKTQGWNRKIFLRGQSHFSWCFPGVKCLFPVENVLFGKPKTNLRGFERWEAKKKKKKKKKKRKKKEKKNVLSSFCNFCNFSIFHFQFQPSLLQFSSFLLNFFTPFHFFLASFFPGRSAKILRSEVEGALCPACYATGYQVQRSPIRSSWKIGWKCFKMAQITRSFCKIGKATKVKRLSSMLNVYLGNKVRCVLKECLCVFLPTIQKCEKEVKISPFFFKWAPFQNLFSKIENTYIF